MTALWCVQREREKEESASAVRTLRWVPLHIHGAVAQICLLFGGAKALHLGEDLVRVVRPHIVDLEDCEERDSGEAGTGAARQRSDLIIAKK
jgi:hypothetical protein